MLTLESVLSSLRGANCFSFFLLPIGVAEQPRRSEPAHRCKTSLAPSTHYCMAKANRQRKPRHYKTTTLATHTQCTVRRPEESGPSEYPSTLRKTKMENKLTAQRSLQRTFPQLWESFQHLQLSHVHEYILYVTYIIYLSTLRIYYDII